MSKSGKKSPDIELDQDIEPLLPFAAAFMMAASQVGLKPNVSDLKDYFDSLSVAIDSLEEEEPEEEEYEEAFEAEAEEEQVDSKDGIDDDPAFDPPLVKNTGVGFKNVGGVREIKGELQRVVRFLKSPDQYRKMGAKLPRGILFKGPPGTGKTLLARAMAKEAGVPFISVSGTEFESMYTGVGPARMRKLVNKAKTEIERQKAEGNENASCIIFIDEIDVFGAQRTSSRDSGHQIVMMELARLMDGFDSSDGITVMATTNRPEMLDPALVRPGRFDLSLEVPAPDLKGRKEILNILVRDRKIPLKVDVDLGLIAKKTFGFAGAELNLLVNEAAIIAADKGNARKIGMAEFELAYNRVLKGPRRHLDMSIRDKESTAVHEAGHAIAGLRKEIDGMAQLRNVTILPHIGSLGTTYFGDEKETYSHTFKKFFAEMVVDYAGRVAEELVYGIDNVSSGASGDIEFATETAWRMVAQLGFNKNLGKLLYGESGGGYLGQTFSQNHGLDSGTAKRIYDEMIELTNKAYEEAKRLLTEDYDALLALSVALVENETLDRDETISVTGIQPEKRKYRSLREALENPVPVAAPAPPEPV
ncbi:MAG: AAA family ATPase [Rhodospirillales bacterium]|nr:AAA family ATPase [Rhodospirillales bacterium]MCB9997268.1 AAA family ATPase [Rhodospirillales bacterium]